MALCPHCRNALPDTEVRHCPNCGGDVSVASTTPPGGAVPPPLPPPSAGPPGGGTPWEDRERLGLANALVETTKRVLLEPTAFFRSMPVSGGIGSPLLYAVLIGWIGLAAAALYQALFQTVAGASLSQLGERPELAEAIGFVQSWAGFVVQLVFGPVFVAIGVFIGAGIFHVMLLLLGGAQRDFEATFRVVSYGEAPAILMLIPFCGSLISTVWMLVLYVIGLSEAHQIGRGRAAAAVLLPLVLVCCCCGVLIALFAGALGALASQTSWAP